MNDSVFEAVETSSRILRLDFSSIEFAKLAEEQDFTEEQIQAVGVVFEHLQRKKVDTTIHTLLKMSQLPLKGPKTFDNFDFSVIKGRDANRLKTLPSLSAIYAHRNLAFIALDRIFDDVTVFNIKGESFRGTVVSDTSTP